MNSIYSFFFSRSFKKFIQWWLFEESCKKYSLQANSHPWRDFLTDDMIPERKKKKQKRIASSWWINLLEFSYFRKRWLYPSNRVIKDHKYSSFSFNNTIMSAGWFLISRNSFANEAKLAFGHVYRYFFVYFHNF